MKRFAAATVFTLPLMIGCQMPDEADGFRNGVPRAETVTFALPDDGNGTAKSLEVEQRTEALSVEGQTSELYQLTRGITRIVNGGAVFVGVLVRAVISYPPTSITKDEAVWGPWDGDALDPLSWKVTITRTEANKYRYRFDGRPKNNQAAEWVTILFGTHAPALNAAGEPVEGFGAGSFTIDWDARQTLPAPDKDIGKASYTYSRIPQTSTQIDAAFVQVKDDDHPGQRVDADYHYLARPGQGGEMDFIINRTPTLLDPAARTSVKSRWLETGAGRSDIKAKDASDKLLGSGSECWDTSFATRYLRMDWAPQKGFGNEATDCVFSTAVEPRLSL